MHTTRHFTVFCIHFFFLRFIQREHTVDTRSIQEPNTVIPVVDILSSAAERSLTTGVVLNAWCMDIHINNWEKKFQSTSSKKKKTIKKKTILTHSDRCWNRHSDGRETVGPKSDNTQLFYKCEWCVLTPVKWELTMTIQRLHEANKRIRETRWQMCFWRFFFPFSFVFSLFFLY